MLFDDFIGYDALRTAAVLFGTTRRRYVEGNSNARCLEGLRDVQQRLSRRSLQVRRVNHRQLFPLQTQLRQVMQQRESLGVDGLIVFVAANKCAAMVRRNDFGRLKVAPREGAFARTGCAEQKNQRGIRQRNLEQGALSEMQSRRADQPGCCVEFRECNARSASGKFFFELLTEQIMRLRH